MIVRLEVVAKTTLPCSTLFHDIDSLPSLAASAADAHELAAVAAWSLSVRAADRKALPSQSLCGVRSCGIKSIDKYTIWIIFPSGE